MLIAHGNIVIEGKLESGGSNFPFVDLSYHYIFPLFITILVIQLQEYSVKILIDWAWYNWLFSFKFFKYF